MKRFFLFLTLCGLCGAGKDAVATETSWTSADYLQARLLADSAQSGALEIRLEKGWHAYWRMPGDGGLAPVFDWNSSENIENVTVSWPVPKRFQTMDLQSFGYEHSVVLPLTFHRIDTSSSAKLRLEADIMVCETICVPQSVTLSLDLPSGPVIASRNQAIIRRVRDRLPVSYDTPSLRIDGVVLGPDALVVNAWSQRGFDQCDLFAETGDVYLTAPPQIDRDSKESRRAAMVIQKPQGTENLATVLTGTRITVTLSCGEEAVEKQFTL